MIEIDPRWRTSAVMDLCAMLRETHDVSRLPILRDALMDAGCDDEELLSGCLSSSPVKLALITSVILGGDTAWAVHRMEALARELGPGDTVEEGGVYGGDADMTAERLVWMAWQVDTERESGFTQYGSENWQNDFGRMEELWEYYETIIGRKPKHRKHFFSCTC